jgi:hypothetical protein
MILGIPGTVTLIAGPWPRLLLSQIPLGQRLHSINKGFSPQRMPGTAAVKAATEYLPFGAGWHNL